MDNQKKILCMYSGGLDSLGVLYRLLTAPEYREFGLHVHHMHLKNLENRMAAESKAVQATLKYFKEKGYRNFLYTESFHDYSFMRSYFIFDTYWYAFMGANILTADTSILYMAVGRTKSDMERASARQNSNRGHEIFHATLPLELRFIRPYIYPVGHMTKKEIWEMLPPDLRVLAWSCRTPVYKEGEPIACGECKTCKELEEIKGS